MQHNGDSLTGLREPQRFAMHDNAFGFIRLVFASLVIVSHTVALVDGDKEREALYLLTGTTTFGPLALNGFFIVSGFLITASYLNSGNALSYLWKRIIRIYPAFILCSIICLTVFGPLAGGSFVLLRDGLSSLVRMALLFKPEQAGAFAANPLPVLNGAAWTIQYEFACYLGVAGLGLVGLLKRPPVVAVLFAACLAVSVAVDQGIIPGGHIHAVRNLPSLVAMFLAGMTFYFYQDRMPAGRGVAVVATIGLIACLFVSPLVNVGMATFGAWLIFAAAKWGGGNVLRRINNRNDISYGLYLYAWPIQNLLVFWGLTSLWPLGIATWLLSAAAGAASWFLLEKPVLQNLKSRGPVPVTT